MVKRDTNDVILLAYANFWPLGINGTATLFVVGQAVSAVCRHLCIVSQELRNHIYETR